MSVEPAAKQEAGSDAGGSLFGEVDAALSQLSAQSDKESKFCGELMVRLDTQRQSVVALAMNLRKQINAVPPPDPDTLDQLENDYGRAVKLRQLCDNALGNTYHHQAEFDKNKGSGEVVPDERNEKHFSAKQRR